jgi:hypothetical protein
MGHPVSGSPVFLAIGLLFTICAASATTVLSSPNVSLRLFRVPSRHLFSNLINLSA